MFSTDKVMKILVFLDMLKRKNLWEAEEVLKIKSKTQCIKTKERRKHKNTSAVHFSGNATLKCILAMIKMADLKRQNTGTVGKDEAWEA